MGLGIIDKEILFLGEKNTSGGSWPVPMWKEMGWNSIIYWRPCPPLTPPCMNPATSTAATAT
jgi:ABC-type polysaccharide transport system permease subunit